MKIEERFAPHGMFCFLWFGFYKYIAIKKHKQFGSEYITFTRAGSASLDLCGIQIPMLDVGSSGSTSDA